ncbi:MAG: hypothetical protein IPP66_18165 [Anaerolineales bacterium]|nr:hypothetical protein [Anaerolineales bacterium]
MKSDVSMFLLATFSYIAQIADILYVCSVLRINPYIRFGITFTYFTLVMNVFIEDENLRNMIEKTLVSHIFYKVTDGSSFENISFFEYCKRVEEKSLLNSILEKMKDKEIDIFEDGTSKIVQIIKEEFDAIL